MLPYGTNLGGQDDDAPSPELVPPIAGFSRAYSRPRRSIPLYQRGFVLDAPDLGHPKLSLDWAL